MIDLTTFTKESLQQGYEIIICLDVNENMVTGRISKIFCEIGLIESTSLFHSRTSPAVFVEGQHQIDRV